MAREVTFSRTYPAYHPRKGEPTDFVDKIWKCLYDENRLYGVFEYQEEYDEHFGFEQCKNVHQFMPKLHTIRAGKKYKEGDFIKPMVWAEKPYRKTQTGLWKLQIAPEIQLKKVYDFELNKFEFILNGCILDLSKLTTLANNDGLTVDDFECWFNVKEFSGQVLCWSDNVRY